MLSISIAAGKGVAMMWDAILKVQKAGREAAAKAEKGMTDHFAVKIAQ